MSKQKILVVEDDPIIAMETIAFLRDMGYEPIGPAYEAEKAFMLLKQYSLSAILLDIDLDGELSGIDIAKVINKDYLLPFIFITSFSDQSTLNQVKATMPAGYIVKPFREQDLRTTLAIALHNFERSPKMAKTFSLDLVNGELFQPLTEREFEVLEFLYQGLANKEIAAKLYISINTLKTHLKNIFSKMGVQSRTEAIAHIREWLKPS